MLNGKPLLGVVVAPARMEMYSGGGGFPAERRLILDGSTERLTTARETLDMSSCHALTHVNSEQDRINRCFADDLPKRFHNSVRRVWMWGCGLLALTAISRGSHHLFFQMFTYPWDVVPGLAILRAAEGCDTTWPPSKGSWELGSATQRTGLIAASNKHILEQFVRKFGQQPRSRTRAAGV